MPQLKQDEFYWADLEGLSVQLENGQSVGTVEYLYDNAGTDVFVIKNLKEEHHVPFLMHETVLKVDLGAKTMTIDWDFNF